MNKDLILISRSPIDFFKDKFLRAVTGISNL